MDLPRLPDDRPRPPDQLQPWADVPLAPGGWRSDPPSPDHEPAFVRPATPGNIIHAQGQPPAGGELPPATPSPPPAPRPAELADTGGDSPGTPTRPEAVDTFDTYLGFPSPEARPWEAETITRHLTHLGAERPTVTETEATSIRDCYTGPHRFYHGPDHGAFVGQPSIPESVAPLPEGEPYDPAAGRLSDRVTREWAESVNAVAGLWHDAAYKHVDEQDSQGTSAWSEGVSNLINDVARYERTEVDGKAVYRTYLTEAGAADAVTQMVAHIFKVGPDGIIHNQGGNEFDSALAAAKFLESKGADAKTMVTAVAGIAATIPFRPALGEDAEGRLTDGHMGDLAHLVKTAQLHGYQADWQDVNDIMHLSVTLANRDIAPFIRSYNLEEVIHNGRGVKLEEIRVLRERVETLPQLVESADRTASAPLLYEWIGSGEGPVPAANVPHIYIPRDADGNILDASAAYPPLPVYEAAVHNAATNSRLSSTYFKAHEAGITLAAAIATSVGEPDAMVPGFVGSIYWSFSSMPQGPQFDALTSDETRLSDVMMYGKGQGNLDPAVPSRSPIGGTIFGSLGTQGVEDLSDRIQQIRDQAKADGIESPFSNPDIARDFLREVVERIGTVNARTIFTELQQVAQIFAHVPERGSPDRADRIRQLAGNLGLAA